MPKWNDTAQYPSLTAAQIALSDLIPLSDESNASGSRQRTVTIGELITKLDINPDALAHHIATESGWEEVSGAVTLDLALGYVHALKLTGDVTSVAFSNVPSDLTTSAIVRVFVLQDATGNRAWADPASVTYTRGNADDFNLAADAITLFTFEQGPESSGWFGSVDNGSNLRPSADTLSEVVYDEGGFTNASGAVTLDLASARVFQRTMTGNITSLSFTNLPTEAARAAAWTLVLKINGTGGYLLTNTPTVTFLDGSAWADVNLVAHAVNHLYFERHGSVTYGWLISNNEIELDPYKICFLDNATVIIATEAESIDLANYTKPAGDATITFSKNGGGNISVRTQFAEGDRLAVTAASLTTTTAVRIPRYLASNVNVVAPLGALRVTGRTATVTSSG